MMQTPLTVLYYSEPKRGKYWQQQIVNEYPEIDFHVWPETVDLESVEVLVVWKIPQDLLSQLPNLKAIFTVSAGIDQIDFNLVPPQVDVVRMIDDDLSNQLAEYAVMSSLMIYRGVFDCQKNQDAKRWQPFSVAVPQDYKIGVMGLGQQGTKMIERLKPFNFNLSGWSRSLHHIDGVCCYDEQGLNDFLANLDILICVLPLTDSTRGLLNQTLFEKLPEGCSIINIGRGEHLVTSDLLDALNAGQLKSAILDVTEQEPLEDDSLLWTHPDIMITPHIAGTTRSESGFHTFISSLLQWKQGIAPEGLVSRNRGY